MADPARPLIVGAGKLGQRFYHYLKAQGQRPISLSRSAKPWSEQHIECDLLDNSLQLPPMPPLDSVFIMLAPGQRSEDGYRQTYLSAVNHLLRQLKAQQSELHCVFVSSTSVFAGNSQQVITEQTVAQPQGFAGSILLQAERQLQQLHPSLSIVRASGLYSAQRQRLLHSLLDAEQYPNPKWLNLIHEADLCQWLWQARRQQWPLSIAADGHPFTRQQLQDFVRNNSLPKPEHTQAARRCYRSQYHKQIDWRYPSIFDWFQRQR